MAKEKFENRTLTGNINITCKFDNGEDRIWQAKKEDVIADIISIVSKYQRKGYKMTLRQLHYQLVQKNAIVNHTSAYKKLGNILDDCRYSGLIDWNAIEDRGRVPYIPYWANDAADAIDDLVDYFRIDRQDGQSNHVELWTEKDALSGIFKVSTEKYHIQLVVNKGYSSSSAIYLAYDRIVRKINDGMTATILYLGDHDPSGLDMIRDIRQRLLFFISSGDKLKGSIRESAFTWYETCGLNVFDLVEMYDCPESILKNLGTDKFDDNLFDSARITAFLLAAKIFQVLPIGLTMDQIKLYDLPPNPAKETDCRSDKYIEKFGNISWEVDALNPDILTEIVEENIQEQIDIDQFDKMLQTENEEKEKLIEARDRFRDNQG